MTPEEVTSLLSRTQALLSGHFRLTSGLHSDRYVQCALALRDPKDAALLGKELGALFKDAGVTLVAGPAIGGILIAHEVARSLGVPAIFSEREGENMALRRGFAVGMQDRVLAVEDVVTTGGSIRELIELVESAGARVAGAGCIVDRSGGKARIGAAMKSLVALDFKSYRPEDCPMCKAGSSPVKPGSRKI